MSSKIEEKLLIQRQNSLQASFEVHQEIPVNGNSRDKVITSPKYRVNGVKFRLKILLLCSNYYDNENILYLRFNKQANDVSDYVLQFSSKKLEIEKRTFKCDDSTWREIATYKPDFVDFDLCTNYNFDISVEVTARAPDDISNIFATLHEDTQLTDFELRAHDGSVKVHKAILAASSPVLRRMLEGKWSETREGCVEIAETSAIALQHLKDYLYTHNLPETGLEQLLLLASCYMIPDLENKCIDKLMNTVNAENVLELAEFAVRHKMIKLHLAILECFQNEYVKVEDVRKDMKGKRKRDAEDGDDSKKACVQEDE